MDKVTMTRDEAAKFIGVSPDTLTSWCRAGRISYQRKDPFKKKSPYLFTESACLAALSNPINTIAESEIDVKGDHKCQSSNVVTLGIATSRHLAARELKSRLVRPTGSKPRSCTTN
ncbi:helix-turn-helix domain-containing protein [Morganella sp. B601]|nr:helix-turn-helix domain-containing protein [Morganella morganii]